MVSKLAKDNPSAYGKRYIPSKEELVEHLTVSMKVEILHCFIIYINIDDFVTTKNKSLFNRLNPNDSLVK